MNRPGIIMSAPITPMGAWASARVMLMAMPSWPAMDPWLFPMAMPSETCSMARLPLENAATARVAANRASPGFIVFFLLSVCESGCAPQWPWTNSPCMPAS